jgi:hypothetical protein
MEIYGHIYGLVDPRTKLLRYVGRTVNLQRRYTQHLLPSALKKHTHKTHWLRDLLTTGARPELCVIESCCTPEELRRAEIFYIEYFTLSGAALTNATDGGDGVIRGFKRSPAVVEKMRAYQSQRPPISEATRAKISATLTGRKLPEAVKKKLGHQQRGIPRSPETKAKIRAANLGRYVSPETCAKISASKKGVKMRPGAGLAQSRGKGGRPLIDQFGNVYESDAEACRAIGVTPGRANKVARGETKHIKGYIFTFLP